MHPKHGSRAAKPAVQPDSAGAVAYPKVGGQGRAGTAGVVAGLAGAAAFTVFCMVVWAVAGSGVWQPVNLVTHTFWKGAPDDGGFHPGSTLLGLAILALAGLAMGVPLALLLHNIGPPHWATTLALAVVIPNVLWVPGHGLIWPAIDEAAAERFTPLWSWLGHGVYGLVLGLMLVVGPAALPPFRRNRRPAA